MGSINESTSGGQDINFNSKDIKGHTKAGEQKEYFVKFKEDSFGKKTSKWLEGNKKKFITIFFVIVGIAIIIPLVLWAISSFNKPKEEEKVDLSNDIYEIYLEIDNKLNSIESDTPYSDLIAHYRDLYEKESNTLRKFEIQMALAEYVMENGFYEESFDILMNIKTTELNDEQTHKYYVLCRNYAEIIEDDELYQYYDDKITGEIPGELYEFGGGE